MSLNNVFFESEQETHNSSKNANFLTFCFSFSSATKPRDCRAGQLFLYRLKSTRPALTSVFNGITRAGPCGSHDKKIYWKTSKPINFKMRKSQKCLNEKAFPPSFFPKDQSVFFVALGPICWTPIQTKHWCWLDRIQNFAIHKLDRDTTARELHKNSAFPWNCDQPRFDPCLRSKPHLLSRTLSLVNEGTTVT